MTTKQRLIITLGLCVGTGLLILAALSGAGDRNDITVTGNPVIDELIPPRQAEILQRDRVGIDLAEGYVAALTIEAGGQEIAIPADQLDPTLQTLGQFTYKPGEGKALEFFPPQTNCVRATYWPIDDREDTKTIRWCFEVL